jgi:hypothetical protein
MSGGLGQNAGPAAKPVERGGITQATPGADCLVGSHSPPGRRGAGQANAPDRRQLKQAGLSFRVVSLLQRFPWWEETVSVSAAVLLVGTGRMEATPVGKSVLLKVGGDGASVTLLQGQRRGGILRTGGVRSEVRLLRRRVLAAGSAQGSDWRRCQALERVQARRGSGTKSGVRLDG